MFLVLYFGWWEFIFVILMILKKLCIGGIEEGVLDKVCVIVYYFICFYIIFYFCKDLIV